MFPPTVSSVLSPRFYKHRRTPIFALFAGLTAGAAHVVAGPDHLAALAPIAVNDPRRAARLGFLWGCGHGLGVVALGLLGVLAGRGLNIELMSNWAEFAVGLALILVGLWAFRRASKIIIHAHEHDHDDNGQTHSHLHVHISDTGHDNSSHRGHSHAAFAVGLFHGVAGTGHLLGVLPSLAMPTTEALIYLSAYLLAAILSMAAFGALVGGFIKRQGIRHLRKIMLAIASVAVTIGVAWVGLAWPL